MGTKRNRSARKSEEEVKELCESKGLEYQGRVQEGEHRNYVLFICKKHRDKGLQERKLYDIQRLNNPCQYCGGKKHAETFEEEIKKISPNIKVLGKYVGSDYKVKCKCLIHDYEFSTVAKELLRGRGCPICGFEKRNAEERYTNEDFDRVLKEKRPDLVRVGDYVNTHANIRVKCLKCGREYEAYACNILNNSAKCPTCNKKYSSGESGVARWLKSKNIKYIPEYKIPKCRNELPLYFDFYLPDMNTVIEFQGEQHYDDKYMKQGMSVLEKRIDRDNEKRDFCKANNIRLIEIPYWEKENTNIILERELLNK